MNTLSTNYQKHPRLSWALFLTIGFVVLLVQTYIAQPREWTAVMYDLLFPLLVLGSGYLLLIFPKHRLLLFMGMFFWLLCILTYFFDFIPKPYGTFSFLFGTWALMDSWNFSSTGKSIFQAMTKGDTKISAGILLSTFIFGLVTEIINLPFGIWQYFMPIPSLQSFGVPALIAAFGWTPWTLAILSIFYRFVVTKK